MYFFDIISIFQLRRMLLSSVSKTLELILVVTKVHQTPFGDVIGCNVRIARSTKPRLSAKGIACETLI